MEPGTLETTENETDVVPTLTQFTLLEKSGIKPSSEYIVRECKNEMGL